MATRASQPRVRRRWLRRSSLDRFWCALRGHVLVATNASVTGDDLDLVVTEAPGAGYRLHRCLRCLDLVEHAAPGDTSVTAPRHADIVLPPRGRALRDILVLRLIACDKALHAILLGIVGTALLVLSSSHDAARRDFLRVLVALNGSSTTPDQVEAQLHGVLGRLDWLLRLHTGTLAAAGWLVIAYALLNAVEAGGLWFARRWAEYLSMIATSLFIPLELYELWHRVTVFRLGTLIANCAIVGYLAFAKRLFGLRGGATAEHAQRMRDASWPVIGAQIAARRQTGTSHEPAASIVAEPAGAAPPAAGAP